MIASFVLMDAAPIGGPIGVIAGVVFFLIFIALAFIAFRLLDTLVVNLAMRQPLLARMRFPEWE